MLKRRSKKLNKSQVLKATGTKFLVCKECGDEELQVSTDTATVICGRCVQKMVAPPPSVKKEKSDKPRGWHFKAYFEHDGIVYSKGEVVTDEREISALKKLHGKVKNNVSAKSKALQKKTSTVSKAKKKAPVKRGRKNARTSK